MPFSIVITVNTVNDMTKYSANAHSSLSDSAVTVELGPVQETLLIPLLGRARESLKNRRLLQDNKAVEIVESLDYDFAKWNKSASLFAACFRTLMFDRFVSEFLQQHPQGTVVEIGCGLNTRFERIDNGQATWFDLDLADVIELRRRFFTDQPRRTMLAASITQRDWMEPVKATGGPWIFVSEAVLIYLPGDAAQQAIVQLAETFSGAHLAFDTTGQNMVDNQHKHDAMRHLPKDSWFQWACDNPRDIEQWCAGSSLLHSQTFLDADPDLIEKLPGMLKFAVRYMPWILRKTVADYKINVAVFAQ